MKLPAIFDQYCRQLEQRDAGGTREFIRILRLLEQVPQNALAAALQEALELRIFRFEGVCHLLHQAQQEAWPPPALGLDQLPRLAAYQVALPALDQFNQLLAQGATPQGGR